MIDTSSVTQQKSLPLAPQRPSAGDNSRYTTATMIHHSLASGAIASQPSPIEILLLLLLCEGWHERTACLCSLTIKILIIVALPVSPIVCRLGVWVVP